MATVSVLFTLAALLVGQPEAIRKGYRHTASVLSAANATAPAANATMLLEGESSVGGYRCSSDVPGCLLGSARCLRTCRVLGLQVPCVPPQWINGCTIQCPVKCRFKVRAKFFGAVDTTNFMKVNVSFAHRDFSVTHGEQIVRNLVNNDITRALFNYLIGQEISKVESQVRELLDQWKDDANSMLIERLGTDEVFGDYWFLHGFIGNSTELVQALVPLSNLKTDTSGEDINAVVTMPEARVFAEARFTYTMDNMAWWYQILPGLAVGGLIALKFPRVGLAVGVTLAVLTVVFAGRMADAVGPAMMGHANVTIKAKLPEDAQEMGAPNEIPMHAWFQGDDLVVAADPIPVVTANALMTNVALRATADPDANLPIKVVGADFKLWARGHRIEVQDGSFGDIVVEHTFSPELDLTCAPNCPGPCLGMFKC